MFKNQKGITLVALVITIIVLLILATVAISMAVNSEGLFTRAGNAANAWNTTYETEAGQTNNLINYAVTWGS